MSPLRRDGKMRTQSERAENVKPNLLRNLTNNALKPGFLPVMIGKVLGRLDLRRAAAARAARSWCEQVAEPLEAFALGLDAALWAEATAYQAAFGPDAAAKLEALGIDLGGGGDSRLLYFLARLTRPTVAVETGVAAGHSTAALLMALRANSSGHLWSSDFPYFRLHDPERYVGVLVEEHLRERWTLFLDGDRKNLPRIAASVPHIDLLHYDSDKSSPGRARALKSLASRMTAKTVVVMDDIQDNLFFRTYAERQVRRWRVFASANKFVGLVGL